MKRKKLPTKPCEAKIRPFPDYKELTCFLNEHKPEIKHVANIKNPERPSYSTDIYWYEEDRRTFRGDWIVCDFESCILPGGHHGEHAD
jgi:hypothetical protein